MDKITQEQFYKIFELVSEIQSVCDDADTSSINMWLTMVAPSDDVNEKGIQDG